MRYHEGYRKTLFSVIHSNFIADVGWLTESCNVALVAHGDAQGDVSVPRFVANWKKVIDQARPLLDCLNPDNPQGGHTPFQCEISDQSFFPFHLS